MNNTMTVQDFYPTPGTVSTCMYYTGINPLTGEKVYVPKTEEEKGMQKALIAVGRQDLIGRSPKALIR